MQSNRLYQITQFLDTDEMCQIALRWPMNRKTLFDLVFQYGEVLVREQLLYVLNRDNIGNHDKGRFATAVIRNEAKRRASAAQK